ncbi:RES family NAD+ phosphorylase [Cognatiluteimonas profundi]|uniref:RES family NAD+ phosphorylase n=1 Tax=Cognatiluteimonas profundi TaxID=2594501 RepID=UPI00131E907B|nr:RES family NAD+ phosphorylase [Lysobacter profundi]
MTAQANSESTRSLDDALADTFPASDPPSQTSPTAATPSAAWIRSNETGELRIYRVIEPSQAYQPFEPDDDGGRWTPAGVPCVYASLSPATALLEYLAHLEGRTPPELLLAVGMIPSASVISEINEPSTWCELPYRPEVQQVGASWLRSRASLAMRVPSALCRDECNILLNPQHPDFSILQLVALRPLRIDERIRS